MTLSIQRSIQRLSHMCLKYNNSVRSPEICKIKPVRFCYLTSKNVFWDPIIGIWRKYMVYRCIHSGDGMHWIHSFSSIHVSPSKRNVFMWHYKSIFSAETWTGGGGGGGEELSPGQGWSRQGLGRSGWHWEFLKDKSCKQMTKNTTTGRRAFKLFQFVWRGLFVFRRKIK